MAQRSGPLPDTQRVHTDKLTLDRLQPNGVDPQPNLQESVIGLNLDDRAAVADKQGAGTGRLLRGIYGLALGYEDLNNHEQ